MPLTLRQIIKLLLVVAAAFSLTSCASTYYVHKENPSKIKKAGQYKSLYVSWLDLHKSDWEKYGYENQDAWASVIKDENLNGLRPCMKEMFPEKTLYFADEGNAQKPDKGDLYIKLNVKRIDKNWNGFSGGFDDLYVDVSFVDLKTQEQLYSADINTTSMGMGPQGWTFEGRLGFAVYNLCSFIYDKLH